MGSFTVQALSVERLASLTRGEVAERLRGYGGADELRGIGVERGLAVAGEGGG